MDGMLATQSNKAAGGWMDTIVNLIPGRKQAASAAPSDEAIKRTHEYLRCTIEPAGHPHLPGNETNQIPRAETKESQTALNDMSSHHASKAAVAAVLVPFASEGRSRPAQTSQLQLTSALLQACESISKGGCIWNDKADNAQHRTGTPAGRRPRAPPSLKRLRGRQCGRCWTSAGRPC